MPRLREDTDTACLESHLGFPTKLRFTGPCKLTPRHTALPPARGHHPGLPPSCARSFSVGVPDHLRCRLSSSFCRASSPPAYCLHLTLPPACELLAGVGEGGTGVSLSLGQCLAGARLGRKGTSDAGCWPGLLMLAGPPMIFWGPGQVPSSAEHTHNPCLSLSSCSSLSHCPWLVHPPQSNSLAHVSTSANSPPWAPGMPVWH